jgi:hypothetical protein
MVTNGAEVGETPGDGRQTLSQLAARVLDQLSLSSWLPSGALVLIVAFVMKLATTINQTHTHRPMDAISQTFGELSRVRVGGALLLLAAVVILTMVTQAFAFESIRILEGYWGTNRVVEWVAARRCDHYRAVRERLERRYSALTADAWVGADAKIQSIQDNLIERDQKPVFTPNMIAALRASVLGKSTSIELTPDEKKRVDATDWKRFAPPDLMRRRTNLDKRLEDFPKSDRVLPTRLGNVLRHFEDATGRVEVEDVVQAVFDRLPRSLQTEHDEQRTRLDLYCSLLVVDLMAAAVAIARLVGHLSYQIGAAVTAAACGVVIYRAAIASARAYGPLLGKINRYSENAA